MKNQNVAGSCDEKPEAALLNMWVSDCKRGIVVLSGEHYNEKKADVRDLKKGANKLAPKFFIILYYHSVMLFL